MTKFLAPACLLTMTFLSGPSPAVAQESDSQVRVVVTEGVRARVAVADFQQRGSQEELERHSRLFDDVLWNDLRRAGVFELVPKSFYPLQLPSQPYEVNYEEWTAEDVQAQNLVYGNSYMQRGQFVVEARLIDVNTRSPLSETATGSIRMRRASDPWPTASPTRSCSASAEGFEASLPPGLPLSPTATATRKSSPWTTTAMDRRRSPTTGPSA